LTAIYLKDAMFEQQSLSQSTVTFKTLQFEEIENYWESGEPADKAGAYAIQGGAARFITNLQGSYTGVVGLPLYELNELLQSRN
jgi:septum formation protein